MPPALSKYDPSDQDYRRAADQERLSRETVRQKASGWYDGNIPNVLKVEVNPETGAKIDHNIKVNAFQKRLERRRDFLFKFFPQVDIDDQPEETQDEGWLRQAWTWNKAATLWGLAVLDGGFAGQVFMRLLEPRPRRDKYPRCLLLDNLIIAWQADDVATHLWYEQYYEVGSTTYRQDIVDLAAVGLAQRGWGVYHYKRIKSSGPDQSDWVPVTSEDYVWDYELGPIVTWPHWPRSKQAYGAGEFGDIELNKSINRILSLGGAVIRNHGFPKTIATGVTESEGPKSTSVNNLWTIANENASVFNLEMQSDLSAIGNFIDRLERYYNSQGRTVDVEGGPADFANITNLAIKVSFMPQDDANEILKRGYGDAVIECSRRLLMLARRPYDGDLKLVWTPALPESKDEVARVVQVEDTLGLASKETQSSQMGLDYLQEQQRMADEQSQGEGAAPQGGQGDQTPGGAPGGFSSQEQRDLFAFYNQMKAQMGGNGSMTAGGTRGR